MRKKQEEALFLMMVANFKLNTATVLFQISYTPPPRSGKF